jgi:hypothetical protein
MAGPNLSGWTARTVAPQAGLNDGSLASRQANSQTGTPLASVSESVDGVFSEFA